MHGRVPDELVVGDDLVEAGGRHPQGQPLAVAPVDLVLKQQLEDPRATAWPAARGSRGRAAWGAGRPGAGA
jgi:hypothetical protein